MNFLIIGKDRQQCIRWAEQNTVYPRQGKAVQRFDGADVYIIPADALETIVGVRFDALVALPGVPAEVEQRARLYVRRAPNFG